MSVEVFVPTPRSVRQIHYGAKRDADGRYQATYWGTLEEQIAEATAANLAASSSREHTPMDLYTFASDCDHPSPDDMEKFDGVDDLLDAWMAEHHPGLDTLDERWWPARQSGMAAIPLYVEYSEASDAYEENHSTVCMLSPMGSTCTHDNCMEGDEDGCEPGDCRRAEHAREKQDDFWWRFSPEGVAYVKRGNER